jgi:hypothetical protein
MQNITIDSGSGVSIFVNSAQKTTPPEPTQIWNRPVSWLPIPEVTGQESVFYALVPVADASYNNISVTVSGNYIVDWGDGSTGNFSSGTTATHNYSYSQIPSSTNTPFGYRQALIKITPQAGSSLTSITNLNKTQFLDIVASGPNLVVNGITENYLLKHVKILAKCTLFQSNTSLEAIELDYNSFSSLTSFSSVFSFNPNLIYISDFNTFNITNFSSTFSQCNALEKCPNINFNNATSLVACFASCFSLNSLPQINFSSPCNLSSAFSSCYNLQNIPITGNASSINAMIPDRSPLIEFPAINLSLVSLDMIIAPPVKRFKAFGMKSSLSFFDNFMGRNEIIECFNNLGNANPQAYVDVSLCAGAGSLTSQDLAIAEQKGWDVVYQP